MHHIVEHLHTNEHVKDIKDGEFEQDAVDELQKEEDHLEQRSYLLSFFALAYLLIILLFILTETKEFGLSEYLHTNWLDWPSVSNKKQILAKVHQCSKWDGVRMNFLSIYVLLACVSFDYVAQISAYFFCLSFGILEQGITLMKCFVILLVLVPFFLDTSYLLVNKVCPA